MAAGKAFRIKRQPGDGETLHVPSTNSCRACYRPLDDPRDHYCGSECRDAHQRLRGNP